MSKAPQNLKNHAKLDPVFHFFLTFALLANLVIAVVQLVHRPGFITAWFVVMSVVAFVALFKLRLYPLKVQDRIIRLEERLRLQSLTPLEWHAQIYQLSEDQLIGLRFAGDDEVVELAKQTLEHNWNHKQIKERIRNWRADYWRI